ncbi:hypothetical protein [Aestuariivirga sp.]|uniref:hypothetical protein n=1 Tax=Aestuariivirga sp. TaxID=2650926 RepID=UPI00391A5E11
MSQTETILLIVLGFSLASLIALFLGRLMWTAALKLGARRMQRQVPSSLVGLQTERDRLRAEYAMLSQRLGARLELANLRMAEQMAEVSRHRNRLQAMEQAEAGRTGEIRRLIDRAEALEAELAGSKAQETELRAMLAAKEELLRKLLQRRSEEAATPPPRQREAPFEGLDPELRLRQRIEKLTELARATPKDDDDVSVHAPPPAPADTLVAEKLAEAERETEDLEKELRKLDEEWAQRLAEEEKSGGTGSPAVANVISLASRIRDLKKGLGSSS